MVPRAFSFVGREVRLDHQRLLGLSRVRERDQDMGEWGMDQYLSPLVPRAWSSVGYQVRLGALRGMSGVLDDEQLMT